MKTEYLQKLAAQDLSESPASKLEKLIEQIDAPSVMDASLSALIEAGRGNETMVHTRARAQTGDELSIRHVAICNARMHIREEMEKRKRWHGSLAKIPAEFRSRVLSFA